MNNKCAKSTEQMILCLSGPHFFMFVYNKCENQITIRLFTLSVKLHCGIDSKEDYSYKAYDDRCN